MIGGSNFERSQFNRATQAMRQVGSLFKPFVYMAAIERRLHRASAIEDAPVSFNPGPGQPPYEPKNYDREYHGWITLRTALEGSRNVPTIKLMDALDPQTGDPVSAACSASRRRFRIPLGGDRRRGGDADRIHVRLLGASRTRACG